MSKTAKVLVNFGKEMLILTDDQRQITCLNQINEPCAAGDNIDFVMKADTAASTNRHPRHNQLTHRNKTVAANISRLHLVVSLSPHYQFDLINRYLIMAEQNQLALDIVVNKMDLCANKTQLEYDFKMYQEIGYSVFFVSALQLDTLTDFSDTLPNKTHLFIGQSGVGKSTLISTLMPDLAVATQPLTKKKVGKNTTTTTRLYPMADGAFLIDSPGIREFQLDNLSREDIKNGFVEFSRFNSHCQFRNCEHINEPNCAVKTATETGDIHPKRYQSYLSLLSE